MTILEKINPSAQVFIVLKDVQGLRVEISWTSNPSQGTFLSYAEVIWDDGKIDDNLPPNGNATHVYATYDHWNVIVNVYSKNTIVGHSNKIVM